MHTSLHHVAVAAGTYLISLTARPAIVRTDASKSDRLCVAPVNKRDTFMSIFAVVPFIGRHTRQRHVYACQRRSSHVLSELARGILTYGSRRQLQLLSHTNNSSSSATAATVAFSRPYLYYIMATAILGETVLHRRTQPHVTHSLATLFISKLGALADTLFPTSARRTRQAY